MFWFEPPRDVVRVAGPDAATYLHSQLSQAVGSMTVGESTWSFLLQPTGKVDVLLRVWRRADEEFVLDTDGGFGEVMTARLNRFKIRVKADIEPLPWRCIAVRGSAVESVDRAAVPDASVSDAVVAWGGGFDLLGADVDPPADVRRGSEQDFADARIAAGWPAMGAEIVPGETIPAETGAIADAVSFTKGCYPGQELVERMDSRGASAPRHQVVFARRDGDEPGGELVVDGNPVGTITSVGTSHVIASVRRGVEAVARS
jgi:tRNA-modifying protein YgfZ